MVLSRSYLTVLIEGDSKGIEKIYDLCFPQVSRFVQSNSGNSEDARDVFQKALLQIAVRYQKEPFEIHTSFQAYLFAVCKNLWRREINKSKNRVTNDDLGNLYTDEQESAMALMEQKRYELFKEKLNLISENCKKILTLYFAKTSYADIVKAGGYNTETVARQRVFKCKKKLAELVKEDKRYLNLKDL